MPLYLLAALAASLIPVGAVAIAKASKSDPNFTEDGSLIVPVYRYRREPDAMTLLLAAAAGYYVAKKLKVI